MGCSVWAWTSVSIGSCRGSSPGPAMERGLSFGDLGEASAARRAGGSRVVQSAGEGEGKGSPVHAAGHVLQFGAGWYWGGGAWAACAAGTYHPAVHPYGAATKQARTCPRVAVGCTPRCDLGCRGACGDPPWPQAGAEQSPWRSILPPRKAPGDQVSPPPRLPRYSLFCDHVTLGMLHVPGDGRVPVEHVEQLVGLGEFLSRQVLVLR